MTDSVEELLDTKGVAYRPAGKDVLVMCFNPEHDDSQPSTRIDRVSGVFHCLSCGYRGNLFELFNKVRNVRSERVFQLKRKIREIISASVGLSMPEGAIPYSRDFRDIKAETFKKLNAFTVSKIDTMDMEHRLILPIPDVSGKIKAFSARHMNSDASPKYIVYPEGAQLPIYPANVKPYQGSIILVEGIFDAINLIDKGITNVGCLFGTRTISQHNVLEKLNPLILAGTHHVYLLLDGDSAGQKAAEELEKTIKYKTDLLVDIYNLPDGVDPGSLDALTVKFLKEELYKKETT